MRFTDPEGSRVMLLLIQSDKRRLSSDDIAKGAMIHILISRVCRLSYAECTAVVRSGVSIVMGRIYQLCTKIYFRYLGKHRVSD